MAALRNIRHERFAREYVKTGCGAEAYRRVYPHCHPTSTARVCASQLLTKPNVIQRRIELERQAMKRADITIDKILSDYQFALDMAKAQEKPDSVVKAADSQAKIVGLLRERLETGQVGDFSDAESENEIINALTPEQRADLARLLIDAGEHQLAAQDLAEADPASDAVN